MAIDTLEKRYLRYVDGAYIADIDITVEEWKSMLKDENIFYPKALDMVIKWYGEVDHKSTSKSMIQKYCPNLKGTPYNGIVKALGSKVIKYLNRFEVIEKNGGKSYFIIPFEGWHIDYNPSTHLSGG